MAEPVRLRSGRVFWIDGVRRNEYFYDVTLKGLPHWALLKMPNGAVPARFLFEILLVMTSTQTQISYNRKGKLGKIERLATILQ